MAKFRVCVSKPHHRSRGTVLYWYGTVSLGGLEVWDKRQGEARRDMQKPSSWIFDIWVFTHWKGMRGGTGKRGLGVLDFLYIYKAQVFS